MKYLKTVAITAGVVACVGAYWFMSRPPARDDNRRLIVAGGMPGVAMKSKETELPKDKAYEIKQREIEEQRSQAAFVLATHQPLKLAESVTHALKSPMQEQLEALQAERVTVPSYKGRPFSLDVKDSGSTVAIEPVQATIQQMPVVTESSRPATHEVKHTVRPRDARQVVSEEKRTAVPLPEPPQGRPDEQPFNTASIETTRLPSGKTTDGSKTATVSKDTDVIHAAFFGDQTVKMGGSIRFRLLDDDAVIGGVHFARNTYFDGKCTFAPDRILIEVTTLPAPGGGYKKVSLAAHDPYDMQEGIRAKTDEGKEGAIDAASSSVETMLNTVGSVGGIAIGSGASKLFRSAVGGSPSVSVVENERIVFINKTQP